MAEQQIPKQQFSKGITYSNVFPLNDLTRDVLITSEGLISDINLANIAFWLGIEYEQTKDNWKLVAKVEFDGARRGANPQLPWLKLGSDTVRHLTLRQANIRGYIEVLSNQAVNIGLKIQAI